MAEHRIKRDGIIYTIPNDELFEKLKSGDATIDKQVISKDTSLIKRREILSNGLTLELMRIQCTKSAHFHSHP